MEYNGQNILAEAQEFKHAGLEQLDHLALGEREAKVAVLAAMVMGSNVVLVGVPGVAKSTIARSSHRLIDGIADRNVSHIPPLADLSPQQVVGGVSRVTRKSGDSVETIETRIEPILHENTQVMFADEINRAAPHAMNSYLNALEERRVVSTSGVVDLKNVEYSIATMNPAENRQGVFPIAAATASRHAFGAVLGANEAEADEVARAIFGGMKPNPDAMVPIIDLVGLHAIRERARHHTAVPDSVISYALPTLKRAVRIFEKHNIHEVHSGRMTAQTSDIAKTLAVMGGEEAVHEEHARQAIAYMVTGRLGMLGTKNSTEIPDVVNEILN